MENNIPDNDQVDVGIAYANDISLVYDYVKRVFQQAKDHPRSFKNKIFLFVKSNSDNLNQEKQFYEKTLKLINPKITLIPYKRLNFSNMLKLYII